jgi:hypothetical protein
MSAWDPPAASRVLGSGSQQGELNQRRGLAVWLMPAGARGAQLLGLHPGADITPAAAARLADLPEAQAGSLLARLARANLPIKHQPDRYTFHDPLPGYAAELVRHCEPEDERRAALARPLDALLALAHFAALVLRPGRAGSADVGTYLMPPQNPGKFRSTTAGLAGHPCI